MCIIKDLMYSVMSRLDEEDMSAAPAHSRLQTVPEKGASFWTKAGWARYAQQPGNARQRDRQDVILRKRDLGVVARDGRKGCHLHLAYLSPLKSLNSH